MILSDGTTSLDLGSNFIWKDEFDYDPLSIDVEETLNNGVVIETYYNDGAIPVTLEPATPGGAWLPRSAWKTLKLWSRVPNKTMVLTLPGNEDLTVIFNRPALSAAPLHEFTNRSDPEWWIGTIRLLQVQV